MLYNVFGDRLDNASHPDFAKARVTGGLDFPAQLRMVFNELDRNKDGLLSPSELFGMLDERFNISLLASESRMICELRREVAVRDTSSHRYASLRCPRSALSSLHVHQAPLLIPPPTPVDMMDTDEDGTITFQEFEEWLHWNEDEQHRDNVRFKQGAVITSISVVERADGRNVCVAGGTVAGTVFLYVRGSLVVAGGGFNHRRPRPMAAAVEQHVQGQQPSPVRSLSSALPSSVAPPPNPTLTPPQGTTWMR